MNTALTATDRVIERIEQIPVRVPFRDVPGRNLRRELPHWRYLELFELELACGALGHGEAMLYYMNGPTEQATIDRLEGTDVLDVPFDDSLGPGIQIAALDAIGRAESVPIHRLLGEQVHDSTPLAWWCIDMPPEDWVHEAGRAIDAGYTTLKVKGRPWFDLEAQLQALSASVPDWFDVSIDFNATLHTTEKALDILPTLEQFPLVSHFETPIEPGATEEYAQLRDALSTPILLHYGQIDPFEAIVADVCDGLLLNAAPGAIRKHATVAAQADLPAMIQIVGTGISAAFSLHCGGVFEQARLPAVNCHQIFESTLLEDPPEVDSGMASVPDGPGLGVTVNMDAVRSYETDIPESRPSPARIIETSWPDGRRQYLVPESVNALLAHARDTEQMPFFESGVTTRLITALDDPAVRALYDTVRTEPTLFGPNETPLTTNDT
ncbi:mandelate racemase/muconate lactonizing enzyme family protein [Halocatena halophila]|uniref:mandelate racemase/muconate lactonizing enzyme family protein n=1 Tax=Halocatena halophila TaxID=2814576 RepID=UPI002ED58A04